VNLALVPLFEIVLLYAKSRYLFVTEPDAFRLLATLRLINLVLLIFNMLPIYPLDGGQILRALLWFPLGEIRSLQIASIIGLIGGAALAALALFWQSIWTGVMAFFLLSRAVGGWQQAKVLVQIEREERDAPTIPVAPPEYRQ
jgi:Zn-dependent protease